MWYYATPLSLGGFFQGEHSPASNPSALHPTFTVAGATVFASLILFVVLSFWDKNQVVNAIRFSLLALAVGAWVVTTPVALTIGDNIRSVVADVIKQFSPDNAAIVSTLFFTLVTLGLFIWGTVKYRQTGKHSWLVLAIVAALLFFTTSIARDWAVSYMNGPGLRIAKVIVTIMEHLGLMHSNNG